MRLAGRFALASFLAAPAAAQSISSLSTSCQAAATSLISSSFASCVNLVPLVAALSTTGSAITPINSWLSGACAETCSSATLANASSTITTGCSSDISSSNTLALGLVTLTSNYSDVKDFLCLGATSNSTYCLTNLLTSVQNATNTNISASTVTSLLTDGASSLASFLSEVPASAVCTDCFHAQISKITVLVSNSSSDASYLSTISTECGAAFVDGSIPSTVSELTSSGSGSTTTTASSGSVSSTSLGAAAASGKNVSGSLVGGALGVLAFLMVGAWSAIA